MTVGLWDSVTGFFEDLGDFFSGKDFFECAGYAWNDMMQLASDVLTKNPAKGTYKDVWEGISTIYTTLNVVAVSLLCVFFLYGFCRDSCDLHTDLTFDKTIKMFIRLIITKRNYGKHQRISTLMSIWQWLGRMAGIIWMNLPSKDMKA